MKHVFQEKECLKHLRHYLPAQAPLKDFIHHNTLHAFQSDSFFDALQRSTEIFGYKTALSLNEYKELYHKGQINDRAIDRVLEQEDSVVPLAERKQLMLTTEPKADYSKRIGQLRKHWKSDYKLDLSSIVHLDLFRLAGAYLDQGISVTVFPTNEHGFLASIRALEEQSFFHIFKSKRARKLLFDDNSGLQELLQIVVGDEDYFEQYLMDQQFEHPGWSGMVSVVEERPHLLFERKEISLREFICVELLLEIDVLDRTFGEDKWSPIAVLADEAPLNLFEPSARSLEWELRSWWQKSFEWSYYDQVIRGLKQKGAEVEVQRPSFQAFFCIDDREESIRRHIELIFPTCETFGTPAHFNLPIFYRPAGGQFNTQVCPGVIHPKHIILDDRDSESHDRDLHFHQSSHKFFSGWMIAQTFGFWSAFKLFLNVFKPSMSPGHSSSFEHMSHKSQLTIENDNGKMDADLQIGFSIQEMSEILQNELQRTGLTENFSSLVYFFGHGGSSTNNPYYAGYNCGACSGRPSSLNARVLASIGNRTEVRALLAERGLVIPEETQFLGGLHDTTRDEFAYYDVHVLNAENQSKHSENVRLFELALANNAKERSRQFSSVDITLSPEKIHQKVKNRSLALFEPRPELNHSNNCLCVVGNRKMTKKLFLDQRAFLNSYNWKTDPEGKSLATIMSAVTPVCGGINLEYYFSRVDNENFGAGSKLSHNVVGLFGLANGIEGDLRTGLPTQMIEVHAPLRLLMILEQKIEVVERVLAENPAIAAWYQKEWLNLVVVDPEARDIMVFRNGGFESYESNDEPLLPLENWEALFESTSENLPVLKLV